MKTNKMKKTIEEVGLNYQKEIFKIFLIDVLLIGVGVFCVFYLKQILFAFIALILLIISDYLIISSYSRRKVYLQIQRDDEFIALISYFQTFITNGQNVYQAFSKLLEFSSRWMKDKIENFLKAVDEDKTVKPYVDFAGLFSLSIAKNVMLSIFQMVDEGESSMRLYEFLFLFQSLVSSHYLELKEQKDKSLTNVTVFPLIGAGMIIAVLSVSIISVVGDLINVI